MMQRLDSEIILNIELVTIGITSMLSLICYGVILWEVNFSFMATEQDRSSFDRSMKLASLSGLIFNLYQIIFLIELTNAKDGEDTQILTDIGRTFYCLLIYCTVLSLSKLKMSQSGRCHGIVIGLLLVLPALVVLILGLCSTLLKVNNTTVSSSLHLASSSILLILLNINPIIATIVFAVFKFGRTVTERFCQVAGRLLTVFLLAHLISSLVYNVLYNFSLCTQWNCGSVNNSELSPLHQEVRTNRPPYLTTTTSRPSTTTSMTSVDIPANLQLAVVITELVSQILLAAIPCSYLWTVYTILKET